MTCHDEHLSMVSEVVLSGPTAVPDYPPIPQKWGRKFRITHADWRSYQSVQGYCPGDDEFARTMDAQGIWEGFPTVLAMSILDSPPSLVLDFGAGCGWYTLLAASFGHRVWAIEADEQIAKWLRRNVEDNGFTEQVRVMEQWVNAETEPFQIKEPVRLVKADIEGLEAEAVRVVLPSQPEYFLLEISPEFGDHHAALDLLSDYDIHPIPDKGFPPERFAADPLGETLAQLWKDPKHQIMALASRR